MFPNGIDFNFRQMKTAVVALALVALVQNAALAAEKKIQRSHLPPAVEKTVEEQSKGAVIVGYVMDSEKGQVNYEVEMTVAGKSKDLTMDKNGNLVEVEEEVALDGLPTSVKQGIVSQVAGAKIVKVESLSKNGKLVAYEASTLKGTKKGEVAVTPTGQKKTGED